jgi:hypothetical protein
MKAMLKHLSLRLRNTLLHQTTSLQALAAPETLQHMLWYTAQFSDKTYFDDVSELGIERNIST